MSDPHRLVRFDTVLRRFGTEMTHVVEVLEISTFAAAWPSPAYPFTAVSLPLAARCGAILRGRPAVMMKVGTKVRCRYCRRFTGIEEQTAEMYRPRHEEPA